jgi:hypothetical protein
MVLAMDLAKIYPVMCGELDWQPHKWQMTLLFAAYIGLSATLTIGFCSAMMVTAQEGDD